jgi:hypothetical protein
MYQIFKNKFFCIIGIPIEIKYCILIITKCLIDIGMYIFNNYLF